MPDRRDFPVGSANPPDPTDDVIEQPGPIAARVASIDLLRGVVMVVMVLDHVRDYFTDSKLDATDLAVTTPALFLTRWVTHFCAPTFLLLSGVSASLSGSRRSRDDLSRRLATRGLWLIFLEQTWGNVFIFFTFPQVVLGLVLWAIGWSMIALAGLVYLPRAVIGGIGLAIISLHNLTDGVRPSGGGVSLAWGLLHEPGLRTLPGGVPILIGYPLIPWVGVMALGYAMGPLFRQPAGRRRAILMAAGLGSIAGFAALRASNLYGDPQPWAPRSTAISTAMSFLNCRKYPPSLLFLMMTLGPALVALSLMERGLGRLGAPLRTFGRVPLFFYLLQWPIAHGLAVALEVCRGHQVGWMFRFPPFQSPPGYGYGLPTVYLSWAITVALLYYPSRWYADSRRLRSRRSGGAARIEVVQG